MTSFSNLSTFFVKNYTIIVISTLQHFTPCSHHRQCKCTAGECCGIWKIIIDEFHRFLSTLSCAHSSEQNQFWVQWSLLRLSFFFKSIIWVFLVFTNLAWIVCEFIYFFMTSRNFHFLVFCWLSKYFWETLSRGKEVY